MRRRSLCLGTLATLCTTLTLAVSAAPAAATPGELGGLDTIGYCQSLGYSGTADLGNTILTKGGITGPNFAYGNWGCIANNGATVPIAATGPAPSETDMCRAQYLGVASFAFPSDPNDAFTWDCYLLPPAAGPGIADQDRAAVSALLSIDSIQSEISTLRNLVSARHVGQAVLAGGRFLYSQATQELVADVLGAYRLQHQQQPVTAKLGIAILRAVLNQP